MKNIISKHKFREVTIVSILIYVGFIFLTNYSSGVLRNYGLNIEFLSYIWLIAPLTGLIIHPIIGYISDRDHFKIFGGRSFYIMIGSIIMIIGLFLFSNANYFNISKIITSYAIISIFILDIGLNISLESYKALMVDCSENNKIKNRKIFAYSDFIGGISAITLSILPFLFGKILNSHLSEISIGQIDPNIKYTFYAGIVIIFISLIYLLIHSIKNPNIKNIDSNVYCKQQESKTIEDFFSKYWAITKSLKIVGIIQCFSRIALFMLFIFTTDMIASHIFHLNHKDTENTLYYEAQEWTGVLFAFTTTFSMITSVILMYLPRTIKNNIIHSIFLFIGCIGFISCFFISTKELLIFSFCCIGCAMSSIYTLPYALVSEKLHKENAGLYVGVLNFFITFPQIISGLTSGIALKYLFNDNPIYIILTSGVCLFIASIISFFMLREENHINFGKK